MIAVSKIVNTLPVVDTKYGCIYLPISKLNALPLSLRNSVLHTLASYVSCTDVTTSRKYLYQINTLPNGASFTKPVCGLNAIFFPLRDQLCIAKPCPTESKTRVKVELDKPLVWDKRWRITFSLLPEFKQERHNTERSVTINGLKQHECLLGRRSGLRKIRTAPLPHVLLRKSLPVVRDSETKKIVLIPHLDVTDRSYGLKCDISFCPSVPLEVVVNTAAHTYV